MSKQIRHSTPRGCLSAIAQMAMWLGIGVLLGGLFWLVNLTLEGKSVIAAFEGEVDDALPTLQGIATLGGIVGGAVGSFYCLARGTTSDGTAGTNEQR